ncbi:MAG: sulfotransferase [Cellvibrionaceae bacterium]
MSSVFIVGAARSGTTSLVSLLELSRHVVCASEPMPNLNVESRRKYDNALPNSSMVLHEVIGERIARATTKAKIYVEKQVSLVPFVGEIHRMYGSKFIIPYRDGRDVVSSMMNWHQMLWPIIYSESQEITEYSEVARKVLNRLDQQDEFDISLPRPQSNDPYYEDWPSFSRFEMVCWYWGTVYRKLFEQLSNIPLEDYLFVDFTKPDVKTIKRIYDFLDLEDFDSLAVDTILEGKVNSLKDRGAECGAFPYRDQWSQEQQERFLDFNLDVVRKLGGNKNEVRNEPYSYGGWWKEDAQVDPAWYQEIYEYREYSHNQFFRFCDQSGLVDSIERVIDVGSGLGYGYNTYFSHKEYVGVDLSEDVVGYANRNNEFSLHQYVCADVLKEELSQTADLVTCHATIDNVYDISAFISRLASLSTQYLYVTSYRGYFHDQRNHKVTRDVKMGVNFNNISPTAIRDSLELAGYKHIEIFPIKSNREDIPVETVIAASRLPREEGFFRQGHELYDKFEDYCVEPSTLYSSRELLEITALNKKAFIEQSVHSVTPLEDFDRLSDSINNSKSVFSDSRSILAGLANSQIRIDVDIDVEAAVSLAAYLQSKSIKAIFYICHSAPYYGVMSDGTFKRNECLAAILQKITQYDHEIGFHADPYFFYTEHFVDGSQAVVAEIDWLRAQGLIIESVTGHNAAPFNGAESIEIFEEYAVDDSLWVEHNFVYVPKAILSASKLGLKFDGSKIEKAESSLHYQEYMRGPSGSYVIQNKTWMKLYLQSGGYCNWGWDFNIWLLGADSWVIAGCKPGSIFHYNISTQRVCEFMGTVDSNDDICITLHPLYVDTSSAGVNAEYTKSDFEEAGVDQINVGINENRFWDGVKERLFR